MCAAHREIFYLLQNDWRATTDGIVFTILINIIQKEPVCLKRTQLMNVLMKILIVRIVVQKRKQVKAEMNGTGLNLQILMAIRTVIFNHIVNKL